MQGQWPQVLGPYLLIHPFPTFQQPERGHVLEGVPSDIDLPVSALHETQNVQIHPDVQILIYFLIYHLVVLNMTLGL